MLTYSLCCLAILIAPSKSECLFINHTFLCQEVEYQQLEYQFYKQKPEESETTGVEIVNCEISHVESLLPNLEKPQKDKIQSIKVTNSGVNGVSEEAFVGYENLLILDMSDNHIENILFIKYLPITLEKLVLRNNNVFQLEDVFTNFEKLQLIDMSFCKLQNVDFSIFKENVNLALVNVSHNVVVNSVSKEFIKNIGCVDISYNNLTTFENIPSYCLDFSHTYIPGYHWYNVSVNNASVIVDKLYYRGNNALSLNATNILKEPLLIEVAYLDASQFFGNVSELKLSKVKVIQEFILKDSVILALDKSVYDFQPLFYPKKSIAHFDLSNCSINDISEFYFEKYSLGRLNLCYNNVTILKNNVFHAANIKELDLCHSGVLYIENNTFDGASVKWLNLMGNKLNSIYFIRYVKDLEGLDLSFNQISLIDIETFSSLPQLEKLNLSNNLITTFGSAVFTLSNIKVLDLSNNKLSAIKSLSFYKMPNLNQLLLDGNTILLIQSNGFETLPTLKSLYLSNMGINNLQPEAFVDLNSLEIIYLNSNNLLVLPANVIVNVPNLKTINLQQNEISSFVGLNNLNLNSLEISINGNVLPGALNIPQLRYLYIDPQVQICKQSTFLGLYNLKELYFNNQNFLVLEQGCLDGLFKLQHISPQLFSNVVILKRETFRDLRVLENLDLSGLVLEVIEPEAFVGLNNLQVLLLNNNKIKTLQRFSFRGLNNVVLLDVSQNHISDIYLGTFEELNNLKFLLLHQNNISFIPLGTFHNLTLLTNLSLSRNQISQLPVGVFSNMFSLRNLHLSLNKLLYISCPEVFFPLKNLQVLNLEGNLLNNLDAIILVKYLPTLNSISVDGNNLTCHNLMEILNVCNTSNISVHTKIKPIQNISNINGLECKSDCTIIPGTMSSVSNLGYT